MTSGAQLPDAYHVVGRAQVRESRSDTPVHPFDGRTTTGDGPAASATLSTITSALGSRALAGRRAR